MWSKFSHFGMMFNFPTNVKTWMVKKAYQKSTPTPNKSLHGQNNDRCISISKEKCLAKMYVSKLD